MTRETKIGLLVGLAFIIVIGILLSDFSSNELPQAALNNTGNSVRDGLTSPSVEASDAPSNINVVVQRVTPRQQVLTPRELSPQQVPQGAPTESISVGPGNAHSPITIHQTSAQPPAAPDTIVQNTRPQAPVNPASPAPATDTNVPEKLQQIADSQNEPLVSTGLHGGPAAAPANMPGTQKHVAEAGDSLSKIAARYLGSGGKAAQDAIVKANPSLAANPNMIIVGRTYIIPAPAPAAPVAIVPTTRPAVALTPAPSPAASNTIWYTVKEGDNLWSIAASQLGSGPAYTAIKELNQDVLKGKENVVVNMRLRLPAGRPVASAQ